MEKLIQLLNEFEKERKSGFTWRSIDSYDNCVYGVDCDGETEITMYSDLYSKQYGFIKWLVDNDKLKDNGIKPRTDLVKEIQIVDYETGKVLGWKNQYSETEQLTMYLSIQDNPIEFLISILK